jgi:prepilin-type N-terminal cleavage/methylation domain-containing protein/prepilin-type processing-associated H-X9-DG protein
MARNYSSTGRNDLQGRWETDRVSRKQVERGRRPGANQAAVLGRPHEGLVQPTPLYAQSGLLSRGKMLPRRLHGFSLAELLVVMAVITILAAFLFPVLATARQRAQRTTCLANLKQIAAAQALYLQDWDERFPHWLQDSPTRPEPMGSYTYWTERLQPYIKSEAVFHDPGFSPAPWPVSGVKLADYSLMTWGPGGKGSWVDPYWCWPGALLTLTLVVRPSETCSVADGYTTTQETQAWSLTRHGLGLNVAFVDGHARWLSAADRRRRESDGSGFTWLFFATADR